MNRTIHAGVLLLVLLATRNAAASDAYYDMDDPNPAPLKYADNVLGLTVEKELAKKKLTVKVGDAAADVSKLGRVEKIALLYTTPTKPGSEEDLLVEVDGKLTPVEAHWDGDTITLKVGQPREKVYGKPTATKEEIQKKYGIGAFVDEDVKWDDDMVYVVESALALLSKEELEGIAGLPFHRMKKDPGGKKGPGLAALYAPERGRIEVYDHAMEGDRRKFVGTVDKLLPRSVQTIVHECGHAISRRGSRDAKAKIIVAKKEHDELQTKVQEESKKYNADKAAFNKSKDPELGKSLEERAPAIKQLQADLAEKRKKFDELSAAIVAVEKQGSPLERALDAKHPFKKAPTAYGRTSPGEAYAESFALFKVDRAALERASPGVAAWFESAEYTGLLK